MIKYEVEENLNNGALHPFQLHENLPVVAHLFKRETMNDSVLRKWLTYEEKSNSLYCSYSLVFELPNSYNLSPFVVGWFQRLQVGELEFGYICINKKCHKCSKVYQCY